MADELYYWRTPDGKLIVNDKKQPIKCATCPCGGGTYRAYYMWSIANGSTKCCNSFTREFIDSIAYKVGYTKYTGSDQKPPLHTGYTESSWFGEEFNESDIGNITRELVVNYSTGVCKEKYFVIKSISKTENENGIQCAGPDTTLYDYEVSLSVVKGSDMCDSAPTLNDDNKIVAVYDNRDAADKKVVNITARTYTCEKSCKYMTLHVGYSYFDPTPTDNVLGNYTFETLGQFEKTTVSAREVSGAADMIFGVSAGSGCKKTIVTWYLLKGETFDEGYYKSAQQTLEGDKINFCPLKLYSDQFDLYVHIKVDVLNDELVYTDDVRGVSTKSPVRFTGTLESDGGGSTAVDAEYGWTEKENSVTLNAFAKADDTKKPLSFSTSDVIEKSIKTEIKY